MFGRCGIPFTHLVAYALSELPETEVAALQQHLDEGCAGCKEQLAWLRCAADLMRSDDSIEPPAQLLERAVRLLPRPTATDRPRLLHKLLAALVFDSRHTAPAYGLRGGAPAERQLLFSAPGVDVDMRVQPGERDGEVNLLGQVLTESGDLESVSGAEIALRRGRRQVLSRRTDSLGEFTFARLCPGQYSLRLRLPDQEIDLPGLEI